MTNSWILAGLTLGVFLLFAAGIWKVAQRTHERDQRRSLHRKMWFFVICGVALSLFAFWTDSRLRQTTLYEAFLDGTPAHVSADQPVVRVVEFPITHPGVEHDLLICPKYPPPTLKRASFDIHLTAHLTQDGEPPLLDEAYLFRPQHRSKEWRPAYLSFTPTSAGPHRLTLQLQTPHIPAVHVRIADPLKTDGKRMPGY